MDDLGLLYLIPAIIGMVIVVAVPVLAIIHWWTAGRIDSLPAFLLLLAAGLLGFGLFLSPAPWMRWLAASLLAVGTLAVIYVWLSEDVFGNRALDRRNADEYGVMVLQNPQNIAARVELAKSLHRMRRYDEAIRHLEFAIGLAHDPASVSEERRLLAVWQNDYRRTNKGLIVCPLCGVADIDPTPGRCPACGGTLSNAVRVVGWVESGRAVKIFIALAGGFAIATLGVAVRFVAPGELGAFLMLAGILAGAIFIFARWPKIS